MKTILSASLIVLLSGGAVNAASVTWAFKGNEYSGTGDDLAGEVLVTLDDQGTPGSVNIRVDATALPATSTDSISFIYFNTVFDSDTAPFIGTAVQNNAGGSYKGAASNEDGFAVSPTRRFREAINGHFCPMTGVGVRRAGHETGGLRCRPGVPHG